MTPDELRAALPGVPEREWLADAEARVRADPELAGSLFARAGRKLGRLPLPGRGEWTGGQIGRVLLLIALGDAARTAQLYQHGDATEKLAVLSALPLLDLGDAGVPLLLDALRTNDTRLVAAAMGPYAVHLDAAAWRQGVIKCVFMGIPLVVVHRLEDRADAELAAMLSALAQERAAAGRRMPQDALSLLNKYLLRKED